MPDVIPLRELRNNTSDVLRRAEAGEEITVTISGRAVARIGPTPHRRQWMSWERFIAVFGDSDIDGGAFMADVRPTDRERVDEAHPW